MSVYAKKVTGRGEGGEAWFTPLDLHQKRLVAMWGARIDGQLV